MREVVLQRVVLPEGIELPSSMAEVLPLYVGDKGAMREVHLGIDIDDEDEPDIKELALRPEERTATGVVPLSRNALQIEAHARASFDTYFNRLYAGYLVRWTGVRKATLRVRGSGPARITVKRSTREGREVIERVVPVTLSDEPTEIPISLEAFLGGGCAWFEVEALDEPVVVRDAAWLTSVPDFSDAVVDVGICTYNRPADVVLLLRALLADPEFLSHVGRVWLVDNGTKSFLDEPDGETLQALWGERLRIVNQPNLGGSGGFSRALHEATRDGGCDYVLLMDDDVLAEPESLRRAVVVGELATTPMAVGGHMLLRQKPTTLHTSGERLSTKTFFPETAPLGAMNIRLDLEPLDEVIDAGYNGWWACLLPADVVRKVGLSLPFFIKFDDVEYGTRMARAGVPTATWPGIGVWHESWELKDIELDWSWYFVIRNRLLLAAMMSGQLPPKLAKQRMQRILTRTLRKDVLSNLARRSFSSAYAANQAMADFLGGPGCLDEPLDELVARVRADRKVYPGDEVVHPYAAETKAPKPPRQKPKWLAPPALAREFGLRVPRIPVPIPPRLLERTPKLDEWDPWSVAIDRGPAVLPKSVDYWWGVADYPDAIVVSMEGGKASVRRRDPQAARELMGSSVRLAREILSRTEELVDAYSKAYSECITPGAWEKQWSR